MARAKRKRPKGRCQRTLEEETQERLMERGNEWKGVRAIACNQDRWKALFEPSTHIVEEARLSKMKWFTFIRHWRKLLCYTLQIHIKTWQEFSSSTRMVQNFIEGTVPTKPCFHWYTHKNNQNWKSELIYLIRPTTCTNKHIYVSIWLLTAIFKELHQ
jgi:uncharacterized protein YeaO (DUF488 family)